MEGHFVRRGRGFRGRGRKEAGQDGLSQFPGDFGFPGRIAGAFQGLQNLPGPPDHGARHTGQLGHFHAVAAIGRTGQEAAQKNDVAFPFLDRDVGVAQTGEPAFQGGQFMKYKVAKRPPTTNESSSTT